ncbi:MAG: bifunctional 3,4-dihydroxy-2-butanone-4-phosphate synthase/GTP cyclohydrolase II [Burkholderiales bacterium]|nr:bifunctional 3,4-dihydroxy-2-butanone-4-phosphate synthase/GTP cyclohydrolase II [Burkholderiales bacterium]
MFNTIDEALEDLRAGKLILVCDDEDRENEGDLVGLADKITPQSLNFMINHGKGLVCCPLNQEYAARLGLKPMVHDNQDNHQTAFTQSVDYISSTTGISAAERALTLNKLANPASKRTDFREPGHIFPLIAKNGGVLERAGHTEAAVDLARLAGANPVGVICEMINVDGTMSRLPELVQFARDYDLKLIHIQALITYRKRNEKLIQREAVTKLPSKFGMFEMYGFRSLIDNQEAVALVKGALSAASQPLVRIHSECLTGDGFASLRCDCGEQLAASLTRIEQEGGILIYLRQEGRGIGLLNKLKAYALQDQGMDTVEANLHLGFADDLRDYYLAAQILRDLGITKIRLLSNNPRKLNALGSYGVEIVERQELIIAANALNKDYLDTKVTKLGHLL